MIRTNDSFYVIGLRRRQRLFTHAGRTKTTKQTACTCGVHVQAVGVEVPGIEPGSIAALPGLLRAQLAMPLLGPSDHASESV